MKALSILKSRDLPYSSSHRIISIYILLWSSIQNVINTFLYLIPNFANVFCYP
ncbi:hypothetical protein Hanom_Chr14g01297081 [Helianthus anomalus]